MIILFGNQKGGCGKTTNCIQFANYLVEKGKEVLVLDLDFQRSLSDRRKEDIATYDNEPKYEVIQTDISNVAKIISDFTKVEQGNLLIDLPGKIDDDALGTILKAADIIICPLNTINLQWIVQVFYPSVTVFKCKSQNILLPNNMRTAVRYETKEQVVDILKQVGFVTDEIPASVAMERINTLAISNECIDKVKNAYDYIIQEGAIK